MNKYEFSIHYKVLIPLFLLIITAFSVPPYDDYRHITIALFCVYMWYQVIRAPYVVIVGAKKTITFKSIFKVTKISAFEISKIEDSILTYKVIHKGGFIKISTLMNDAYGLKRKIETFNSDIESEDIHLSNIESYEKKNPVLLLGSILSITILSILFRLYFFSR